LEAPQLEINEKTMKSQNCKTHNLGILRLPLGNLEVLETKKHFNVVFITRSKYVIGEESHGLLPNPCHMNVVSPRQGHDPKLG
jgi:hypothetical protein